MEVLFPNYESDNNALHIGLKPISFQSIQAGYNKILEYTPVKWYIVHKMYIVFVHTMYMVFIHNIPDPLLE